jgi:hypothetical protein
VESAEESLDDPLADQFQPSQTCDIHRIEEIEPGSGS